LKDGGKGLDYVARISAVSLRINSKQDEELVSSTNRQLFLQIVLLGKQCE
jgi:hypothetical protein